MGSAFRELPPAEPRRSSVPIVFLVILCCLVGIWCIFSSSLIGADLQYFPFVLSGALLGFISLFEIRVGLAVLLLAIGLSPELELFGIKNFRYEDIMFPILFIVWLTKHTLERKQLAGTDLKVPLLIILFLSLLTTLNNEIYSDLDLQSSVLRFGKSVQYYFIFIIVLNSLNGPRDVNAFAALMIVSSAFVGLYGISQYNLMGSTEGFRVSGPPGETANILGGYYVFHMCLATGLLIRSTPGIRFLLAIYLVLMALPFVETLSRTSYVALLIGFAVMWAMSPNRAMGGLLLLVLLLIVFSPVHVVERLWSIVGVWDGSAPASWEARVEGWKLLLAYSVNAPILGKGVGNLPLGAVDNEYMLQLHELGVLGLLIFLWLIFRCLSTSYRLQKERNSDGAPSGFCLGYFGGCIALLVHSVGATTFTTIRTTEPFFFATGILYVYWNHIRESRRSATREELDATAWIGGAVRARRRALLEGGAAGPSG